MKDAAKLKKEIELKQKELAELEAKLARDSAEYAIKKLSDFTPEEKIKIFDKLHTSVMSTLDSIKKDPTYIDMSDTKQYMWEELMEIVAATTVNDFWKYYNTISK
jgi:hypothetical protein